MTEAIRSVIDFGFNTLKLTTIKAFTYEDNIASINILKHFQFILQTHRNDRNFPKNKIFILTKS